MLDLLSPDAPVDLVGHSMGGNIAMIYAGHAPCSASARSSTWKALACLPAKPAQAPGSRYAQWMDEIKALRAGRQRHSGTTPASKTIGPTPA
jgi:thioesterase domain-containing protein